MTVAGYLTMLRRNLVLILVLMMLGGLGSYIYVQTLPKLYRSSASVLVIPERGESTSEIVQGSNYVQSIVQSYALLATSPYVLQPVIDELDLSESPSRLARRIAVETPLNTVVIGLAVTAEDPADAQRIASAVADSLIAAVSELSPTIGDRPAVRLETISPAILPQAHVSPDSRMYAILGAGAGIAIALAIAFLREQLRSRPRNSDDIAELTDLPVLGLLPKLGRGARVARSAIQAPDGITSESLRGIAASLRFVSVDKPLQVMMVTSARPADGKTSVSTGLGLAFADSGRSTLVIDADLRNPSVADAIGIEGGVGLTTVLLNDCALGDAAQPWGHENLKILAGGALAPNPGQLMSSGQLTEVIAQARTSYDIIIIDTSPVLPVSDALWLAPLCDGVIMVAKARATPIKAIRNAIKSLSSTRANLIGVVLNAAQVGADNQYYGTAYGQQAMARRGRWTTRKRYRRARGESQAQSANLH